MQRQTCEGGARAGTGEAKRDGGVSTTETGSTGPAVEGGGATTSGTGSAAGTGATHASRFATGAGVRSQVP